MMNKALSLILIAEALLAAGCTVDVGAVPTRPPVIPETVQTSIDSREFGTISFEDDLDMDGISFFLWPEGVTGQAIQDKVYNVNMSSMAIDREFESLRIGVRTQEATFRERGCEKFSTTPGVTVRDEIAWREVDANTSNEDKIVLEECKKSKQVYTDLTTGGYAKIAGLKEKILMEVGPENWREVNKKTSTVSILAVDQRVQVEITLRIGKVVFSTLEEKVKGKPAQWITGADYIVPRRLLRFQMNELDENRQPTGSVYHFELERAGDFLAPTKEPMARFTGDARLVSKEGKVLRNGSFQINGTMKDEAL